METRLINWDCIKVMNTLIEDGVKVDSLICDIPFNLVQKSWGSIHLFRQSQQDWTDTVTEESMSFDTWFNQTLWIKKACKLLKPWWTVIIFNDWMKMESLCKELEKNKIKIKSLNHWAKRNPMPNEWRRRFVTWREYFVFGTKKWATHTFNVDYPHNWDIRLWLTPKWEKKYWKHANTKPLALMKEIIKIVTNPWDIVLDPFMGSGSTIIAAELLWRKWIWIELDTAYYEVAVNRLANKDKFKIKEYEHNKIYAHNNN